MVLFKKGKLTFLKGKIPIYNIYLKQHHTLGDYSKDRQEQTPNAIIMPKPFMELKNNNKPKPLKRNNVKEEENSFSSS